MTDLFDFMQPVSAAPAPPRAAPAFDPLSLLPKRCVAWERLLARAPEADVVLFVSKLWTGVILEVLSDPVLGRRGLRNDDAIVEFPPDSRFSRTIHLTPEQLTPIRNRCALVQISPAGTPSIRYRFGAPL